MWKSLDWGSLEAFGVCCPLCCPDLDVLGWSEKNKMSQHTIFHKELSPRELICEFTCDGERPVSFCDVRFPSTNPKLALPWFVFTAIKIANRHNTQRLWHVNKNRKCCNNKINSISNIPVCLPCFDSKYSFILFSTDDGSLSNVITLNSFIVKITRCPAADRDHAIFVLGFSCLEINRALVQMQR